MKARLVGGGITGSTAPWSARAALVLVAAPQAEIGFWGLLAPRSFFTSFPGFGHRWVAVLGSYNEHLVRDYAAAELGFAVLLLAAAVRFERHLVLIAGSAFVAATLPHLAYHLTTTERLSTSDNSASLGGFAVELVLVAFAMTAAARPGRRAPATQGADPHEPGPTRPDLVDAGGRT